MKKILKAFLCCCLLVVAIVACKKNEFSGTGEGTVETKEYIFNRATNTFETGDNVESKITAANGVKFVYTYLVRTGQPNVLVQVLDNSKSSSNDFLLSMPSDSLTKHNYDLTKITGLKVMVKQRDNSTLEGFIPVKYYDPALAQFINFASSITPDILGGTTPITGTVKSEDGIKQVDIYDDNVTENTYTLVNSISGISNVKDYALNYTYTYRKIAKHIKVVATDIYDQVSELIIPLQVDVTVFKPKFVSFSTSITPNTTGTTPITGTITSIIGLKQVKIYDDYKGAYVEVGEVNGLNGSLNYTFNYNYTFRKRAEHIKLIAIDNEDIQSELIIPLNYNYGSYVYRDVVMSGQGLAATGSTNSVFIFDNNTASVKGNCDLGANEEKMSFVMYGGGSYTVSPVTATLSFYSPFNTTNVASNFRCDNVSWPRNASSAFKQTTFKILPRGTAAIDKIYNDIDAGNIDALDAAYLTSEVSATSGFSSVAATYNASAQTYNATNASVILVRLGTSASQSVGAKYALIKVKELNMHGSTVGLSSIKFDIYIQK